MIKIRKWIMTEENHKDSNSFALVVISDGNDKGHIMARNKRKAWDIKTFVEELNALETLEGKPKIIMIKAYGTGITVFSISHRNLTSRLLSFT